MFKITATDWHTYESFNTTFGNFQIINLVSRKLSGKTLTAQESASSKRTVLRMQNITQIEDINEP